MDQINQALKEKIDLFLKESLKTIKKAKANHSPLSQNEIEKISQRICELHDCAKELLSTRPAESTYYNAKIIKDLVEEKFGQNQTSLLEAADAMKTQSKQEPLKAIITVLARDDAAREVFFEDLKDISDELAA